MYLIADLRVCRTELATGFLIKYSHNIQVLKMFSRYLKKKMSLRRMGNDLRMTICVICSELISYHVLLY